MRTIIGKNINKIKSSLLLVGLLIIMIVVVCSSCSKQKNSIQSINSTQSITIEGKWVNPNDNSDWFTVQDTTSSNNTNRYYIYNYKWDTPNTGLISSTQINSIPGYLSTCIYNSYNYNCYLSFTNQVMKMTASSNGRPNIVIIYQKQ